MHMLIRAIVYAQTADEAFVKANGVFKQLCSDERPFDWYACGNESRWNEYPTVCLASSPEGQELIGKGWTFTETHFFENLKRLREVLAANDDESLISREHGFDFRHTCYTLGMYTGPAIWLYDNDGEGIQDPQHLEYALDKWQCLYEQQGKPNPHQDDLVWVVPADVHS